MPTQASMVTQLTSSIEALLSGGDRRSIGRVAEVIAAVRAAPRRLPALIKALGASDGVVALRAADAIEKLSRVDAVRVGRYRATLLTAAAGTADPAIRWNLIQALERLTSGARESARLVRRLEVWYLTDRSAIVRASALDAVVSLAERDARLRAAARRVFDDARRSGSAAVRARARRLRRAWLVDGTEG
ncbi:MAG: hypothetical protein ACHQWU_08540 [Gemmatimonadales bacterium]